jgi:hypothetical protein
MSQPDKVNALEHQRRLDMFTIITKDNRIPYSKQETIRVITAQMLDEAKLQAIAQIQNAQKAKRISPARAQLLLSIEQTKAFDRIYLKEKI